MGNQEAVFKMYGFVYTFGFHETSSPEPPVLFDVISKCGLAYSMFEHGVARLHVTWQDSLGGNMRCLK